MLPGDAAPEGAMRVTGPYGTNDDQVISALSRILNGKVSFADLATRGGLPSGALEANRGHDGGLSSGVDAEQEHG